MPVGLGCCGEPWSPPGPEAEVLSVGWGCGVGAMPVPRRMRARMGEDRPALAPVPVPPQPPVPPSQLTWASTSACRGLRSPTRPLMVRCGRLCPAPAAAKTPSTAPGPPLARPGPAPRPPPWPWTLPDPCPPGQRPLPPRDGGLGGGAGRDGAIGDVGSQRGLGTIGVWGSSE